MVVSADTGKLMVDSACADLLLCLSLPQYIPTHVLELVTIKEETAGGLFNTLDKAVDVADVGKVRIEEVSFHSCGVSPFFLSSILLA
jgi:hypothetical protein